MSDQYPELIGKYKVQGIIAKGGMGVVYKALHPSLKRMVVIKKMTARNKSGNAERFKKEAQILLDLQSPYIVHLFDYFTEAGFRYMVEEFVDGLAIDALIKKQTALPVPVAMLIMQDCCFALKYAHSKEIVHRDIKPGNILISKRGEIKLADFGIASDSAENEENITKTGVALGTPAYMPPEQFENSATVDRRADIYALGIMLYEMITGSKPYPGTFSIETLNTIKKGKFISPRELDKSIPPQVCKLISKMIKPNPNKRYQNIDSVIKTVKKYLKHYDTHEIRVQLAKSVINPKTYEYPKFEQKDKLKKKITAGILSVILFVLVIFGCYQAGWIHKTLLRHWYTPVNVEMIMPHALSDSLDLPIRAFFFENDGKDIPEVIGSRRTFVLKEKTLSYKTKKIFKKTSSESNEKINVYTMKTVNLKHGNYRVKVVVGPYVWWKSFSVDSEKIDINCDFLRNTKRQISFKTYAYDSESGNDISDISSVRILYGTKWVPVNEIPVEKMKSAAVWKIKVSAPEYKDEIFSLLIDWYQDNIIISAALEKN